MDRKIEHFPSALVILVNFYQPRSSSHFAIEFPKQMAGNVVIYVSSIVVEMFLFLFSC